VDARELLHQLIDSMSDHEAARLLFPTLDLANGKQRTMAAGRDVRDVG
jgi:hypothetical protein